MTALSLTFHGLVDRLGARLRGEDGQTMTEYALILAVIAVAIVGALALLVPELTKAIGGITDTLKKP